MGPNEEVFKDSLLIINGEIKAFGKEAKSEVKSQRLASISKKS